MPRDEPPAWRPTAPIVVSLTLLLLTLVSGYLTERTLQTRAHDRFERLTQQIADAVSVRMDSYLDALVHTRALFSASERVTREAFRAFVDGMAITQRHPGIQGIGYSQRIAAEDLDRHELQVQSQGFPEYAVWPLHDGDEQHAILYLEPFNWRNQRALGYNMYSEPTRREAMARARDTGQPAMSGAVTLVQETREDQQPGFLVYVPVYQDGSTPPTVEERRAQLEGFAYSPFRSRDLFDRIFGETMIEADFQIYTWNYDHRVQLYDSGSGTSAIDPTLTQHLTLHIAGQPWELTFQGHTGFVSWAARNLHWYILTFGSIISLMAFFLVSDQVRRRASERQLLQQEQSNRRRAEEEVQAREDFLSIASHELRTPLTSLSLQLQILERLFQRDSQDTVPKARVEKHLAQLTRQSQQISELIDRLMDITRARTGSLALAREPVDLAELVQTVVQSHTPQLEQAGSTLSLDLPAEGLTGCWDRSRVEQVVVNLLTNAIKYCDGCPIQVAVQIDGDDAVLSVADEGPGIPDEKQETIFERFERSGDLQRVGGLGLGLYISREIVEAHGGRITVHSKLGEGATFTVRLPRQHRPGR